MLAYADVCWRMLTYADVCWCMQVNGDWWSVRKDASKVLVCSVCLLCWFKSTCFTGTKVLPKYYKVLRLGVRSAWERGRSGKRGGREQQAQGTQITCFTSTKVQNWQNSNTDTGVGGSSRPKVLKLLALLVPKSKYWHLRTLAQVEGEDCLYSVYLLY
jgi:hypothetical protein